VHEFGYAMPLEVWVQAAAAGLRIVELPVPLVYLDLARSFGGRTGRRGDPSGLLPHRALIAQRRLSLPPPRWPAP